MSSPVQYSDFSGSSYVWEHFLKSNDGLTAKCKLCNIILKTTARSTKGLQVHLKSKHHIEDLSKKGPENAASTSSASTSSSSRVLSPESQPNPMAKRMKITDHFPIQNSANSMEERVARMTAKDGLPFSVFVTSEDLRDLFQSKGFLLPRSSTSIRMMVMNYGMTLRMKVLHELSQLKQSEHRFSLTFDEWTSTGNRRYLNINVHTYANDRALFWNLGLTRIFGSMPATVCVETLKKKMKEFDLDLYKDIVAITTDGASVMVKTGSLIPAFQQLCYAHGLQLGILDVLYKKKEQSDDDPLENSEAEINNDEDRSNITEESEDGGFVVEEVSSEMEAELIPDFNDLINRVRKIVRMFKGSPTKNDVLQGYIKKEFGRRIELDRDCKTRWSSLATMVEKFNKLKLCIAKALIDLGLSTNIEYRFLEHDFDALVNLENILKPVKLAVEVLCRQDANLITAEATLKFMIKKLEDNHSTLASELALSLRRRILQRRRNVTALLIYLQNPRSYHASCDDETFRLPPKSLLRKDIKDFVTRMNFSLLNSSESNDDEEADQVRNVNVEVPSSGSDLDLTLQQELELTISSACNVLCPSPSRANTLESIIKKEMTMNLGGQWENILHLHIKP